MTNVNLEIERKFLANSLPDDLDRDGGIKICQGYIAFEGSTEVRVRSYGDQFFLTVKEGSGLTRREYEHELETTEFEAFWSFTAGKRLEKVRYLVPYGELTIEFDIYQGDLAPLLVAEVEFASEEESVKFVIPSFLGEEITTHTAYKNRKLAIHGLQDDKKDS
ncbi:adenylate cyclase [Pseudomonadota bacterium]